ncbi:MAG: PAS domain-containing protein [Sandaracinaceae bacterium]|nr:PAS domain-containing protein [Sandaracinaceae bacterium]
MRPAPASPSAHDQLAHVIGDPCFGLDARYRVVFWNPAMAALTGAPEAAVVGRSIFEIIPAARDTPVHAACDEALRARVPANVSYTSIALVPGRRFSFGVYPWRDGVVILARDFTEQYALERELAAAIEERDFLLRELQHRAANGVQALFSITRLRRPPTPAEDASIERLARRVRGVIRVQRGLGAHDGAPVAFVRELVLETASVELGLGPDAVDVAIEAGRLPRLSSAKLGVVITELLGALAEEGALARCEVRCRLASPIELAVAAVPLGAARSLASSDDLAQIVSRLGGALTRHPTDTGALARRVTLPAPSP